MPKPHFLRKKNMNEAWTDPTQYFLLEDIYLDVSRGNLLFFGSNPSDFLAMKSNGKMRFLNPHLASPVSAAGVFSKVQNAGFL